MPHPADSGTHTAYAARDAAARRFWPSLGLALLLHLLLGLLAFWGWRSQALKAADDAAPATVGLWNAADLAAALPPVPSAQRTPPKVRPQPERQAVPPEDADIHLGAKKPVRKPSPLPSPVPTLRPTTQPTQRPTARPSPLPTHKATPSPEPQKKPVKPQPSEAKAQAQAQEKAREKARQDALKAMFGEAKEAGKAGGSTTSAHNGQGKSAYKPSNDYLARIGAIIKRNTHFDAGSINGNPAVQIEVRLSPDGTVLGKPRIMRSSGQPDWDAAAVEGIERAEVLPRDPALGIAPPIMLIERRPKD